MVPLPPNVHSTRLRVKIPYRLIQPFAPQPGPPGRRKAWVAATKRRASLASVEITKSTDRSFPEVPNDHPGRFRDNRSDAVTAENADVGTDMCLIQGRGHPPSGIERVLPGADATACRNHRVGWASRLDLSIRQDTGTATELAQAGHVWRFRPSKTASQSAQ